MAPVPVLAPADAVAVAAELAAGFARDAAERDAQRVLPLAELDRLSGSGLLAITVPARHGGSDLPVETVAEVIRLLSAGDPNIGQIPHSHFVYVNLLRLQGTEAQQQQLLFGEVLAGRRFGNAQSEANTRHVRDIRTTLTADGPGHWRLDGRKFYATGALLADRIPVLAHLGPDGPLHVAWVDRHAEGVDVIDDWNGLGQRTTASGSVVLRDVDVPDDLITPYAVTFDGPQTYGAFAQVLHAAIDAGIARAALTDAAVFVREKSRPYPDAKVERAADDPSSCRRSGRSSWPCEPPRRYCRSGPGHRPCQLRPDGGVRGGRVPRRGRRAGGHHARGPRGEQPSVRGGGRPVCRRWTRP